MLPLTDADILENFPHDMTPREGQLECIRFILDSFLNKNKRYVVAECPTGSGKSVIGMTISRFFAKSYYLTIQKFLQSQIINDFCGDSTHGLDDRTIIDLKGRSAYKCTFYENFGDSAVKRKGMFQKELDKQLANPSNCDKGYCRRKDKSRKSALCFPNGLFDFLASTCPYYNQIGKATTSDTLVMNYSSFLYQTSMARRFSQRDLMIVDESHQSEPQLLDFISISIDDKRLRRFDYKLQELELPQDYWISFLENDIKAKVQAIADQAEENDDLEIADEYNSLVHKLDSFYKSMEDEEEWVVEYKASDKYNTVVLKPVFVHSKSHKLLLNHGLNVLFMSATILDVNMYCYSLGVPRAQVAAYRMKNRFPVKNRPIIIDSAAKIVGGNAKMGEWGPKLVAKADEILDRYKNQRGIIHTHNFAIADLLMNRSRHRSRLLYQKNFATKELMLKRHGDSTNTLIVAPAMHEGLDLIGDLSRIQLICKVPWPNFVDNKQLERRLQIDRRYYIWLTALKLIQSAGRSIRSETDWAHTYVLDAGFEKFISDASSMIPSWFKESIEYGEKFKSEIQEIQSKPIEDDIPF